MYSFWIVLGSCCSI